jgi:ribosomal protein S4E
MPSCDLETESLTIFKNIPFTEENMRMPVTGRKHGLVGVVVA